MDEIQKTIGSKAKPAPPPGLVEIASQEWRTSDGRWRMVGLAAAAVILTALYWENLKHFTFVWSNDDNYSHGWLVGPLSLFFANQAAQSRKRSELPGDSASGLAWGFGLIAIGLLCRLVTVFLPVGLVADGSLIICMAGAVALVFGLPTLRKYGFAIGFLFFMIPLPVALYTMLANPLQLIVSRVASVVMNAVGIPVLCEGNMMTLPGDIKMFVAEACSGMRQLTGFLALTAAVAYLSGKPVWYRVILIASAIPVAMVANIARVIVTGLVMYYIDPNYAKGAWHTVEGMGLMLAGLALLQLEMSMMNTLMDLFAEEAVAKPGENTKNVDSAKTGRPDGLKSELGRGIVNGAQA